MRDVDVIESRETDVRTVRRGRSTPRGTRRFEPGEGAVLPSAPMTGRRCRALLLLAAGWLLPAFSAALILHEIDHANDPGAPSAAEALFHGHLHADGEAGHQHAFVGSPDLVRCGARSAIAAPPSTAESLALAPAAPPRATVARRAEPDPGGPSRQALLATFRI